MNLTDILTAQRVEWHHGGKDGEINICCPFCDEARFRLGINIYKNVAHCFNCEWGKNVRSPIAKILTQLEIQEEAEVDTKKKLKKSKFVSKLPEGYERLLPLKKDKDFVAAYQYLRKRRLTNRQIKKHKIGVCFDGEYAYRVVIPVFYKNKLYGFVTRDFTGKQKKKYLNSGGRKTLYNRKPKKERSSVALLIEGSFDALAAERVLKHRADCQAILGKSLKDEQIKLLKTYKKVIRVPDNDRDGYLGAIIDAIALRKAGLLPFIGFMVGWKDTSKALEMNDEKAIENLLTKAEPFTNELEKRMRRKVAFDYRGTRSLNKMTPYGMEENQNGNKWTKKGIFNKEASNSGIEC